jgi:hypothetical protein
MWRFDAVLGMGFTLLVAYGLDRWVQSTRELAFASFSHTDYFINSIIADLLLAFFSLFLAWIVLFRGQKCYLVAGMYLIIGAAITIFPYFLASTPGEFPFLLDPEFRVLRITLLYSSPNTRLLTISTLISVIGLIGLFPIRMEHFRKFFP